MCRRALPIPTRNTSRNGQRHRHARPQSSLQPCLGVCRCLSVADLLPVSLKAVGFPQVRLRENPEFASCCCFVLGGASEKLDRARVPAIYAVCASAKIAGGNYACSVTALIQSKLSFCLKVYPKGNFLFVAQVKYTTTNHPEEEATPKAQQSTNAGSALPLIQEARCVILWRGKC